MGSCMSTEKQPRRAQITNISGPQHLMMYVPRPRVDYNGRAVRTEDHELDRQTLEAALTTMAEFIDRQRQNITIITVGGAVNTLLLQNRLSTHDVDFFGTNLNNDQRLLLDEAARYAERQSQTPLGGEWFNNQTMLWLPPNVHRKVTQEAFEQDEVVFERRGLKVVAAPWKYALCGKMNRLFRPDQARPYDVTDAASYLHYHILRHGGHISAARIKRWCQGYQKDTSDDVIRAVNEEYRRLYGRNGIAG
ncbi:MAG: hypothetical protein Q9175_001719 [Cornicularia normoerica]